MTIRVQRQPDPAHIAWVREHQNDPIPVKLLDLMTVVGRLRQIAADDPIRESLIDRLGNSDLPRLQALLPAEAVAIMGWDEKL